MCAQGWCDQCSPGTGLAVPVPSLWARKVLMNWARGGRVNPDAATRYPVTFAIVTLLIWGF